MPFDRKWFTALRKMIYFFGCRVSTKSMMHNMLIEPSKTMVSCTAISPPERYQNPNCIACYSSIEGVDGRQELKWVKSQVGHQDIDVQRSTIDMHLNA